MLRGLECQSRLPKLFLAVTPLNAPIDICSLPHKTHIIGSDYAKFVLPVLDG